VTANEQRARRRGRRVGPFAGPVARSRELACARCKAGLRAEQAEPACEAFFFPFFFFYFIFLLYLNSILILKFGFQIGVPFRYDAHIIVIYIRNLFSYFV